MVTGVFSYTFYRWRNFGEQKTPILVDILGVDFGDNSYTPWEDLILFLIWVVAIDRRYVSLPLAELYSGRQSKIQFTLEYFQVY